MAKSGCHTIRLNNLAGKAQTVSFLRALSAQKAKFDYLGQSYLL